jgi:hypothetical protein
MLRTSLKGLFFSLCLIASFRVSACDAWTASTSYRNDIRGADFNDFAMLFRSAGQANCAQVTAERLSEKLASVPESVWSEWLAGGSLSFVIATGLRLGPQGQLSVTLDDQIRDAAKAYSFTRQPGGCAFSTGNTCLEDYAMNVAAHGWRAAYLRLSGRSWSSARSSALAAFRDTFRFSNTCFRKTVNPSATVMCDATLTDLQNREAVAISLNHNEQTPSYGVGQVTSVSAGFVGLEVAEERVLNSEMGSDYKLVAEFLFREGNAHANPDGAWASTGCIDTAYSDPNDLSYPCFDRQLDGVYLPSKIGDTSYRADMFPVYRWYQKYNVDTGWQSGWKFDIFNDIFYTDYAFDTQWGAGRREFYGTLATTWLDSKPTLFARSEFSGAIRRPPYYITSAANASPYSVSTTRVSDANLTIVRTTPGVLKNGNSVQIRNSAGQCWSSNPTGGPTVYSTGCFNSYTTFTIVKLSGDLNDPIAHDDQFALREPISGVYLTAQSGGVVLRSALTAGSNETFILERTIDD